MSPSARASESSVLVATASLAAASDAGDVRNDAVTWPPSENTGRESDALAAPSEAGWSSTFGVDGGVAGGSRRSSTGLG